MNEVDYLERLIKFRSVTGDKSESDRCAQYCADFFKKHDFYTEIIEYKGYPNVIATTTKTKKPKLFLQAHMDVVPGKDELFTLKKLDNRLVGRGVFDMKFACASFMKAIDRLGKNNSDYDFGVMLTFDEEIGGHNGVQSLIKEGYISKVCILPDSGQNWELECCAKGSWFVKLTKFGKASHGSLPQEGINAAEQLIDGVGEILKLREHYKFEELSMNLTKFNSGAAINQTPDRAEAILDIRYKDQEVFEKINLQLNNICKIQRIKLTTEEFGESVNIDNNHPEIKKFEKIAEDVLGKTMVYSHATGATDARYMVPKGVACIIIQPNGGARHSNHEWIEIGGMEKLTEMIYRYIKQNTKIKKS